MCKWVGRSAMPTMLVVAGIGLAACGGSSSQSSSGNSGSSGSTSGGGALSLSDYGSKVGAALAAAITAEKAPGVAAGDPLALSQFEIAFRTAGSTVSGLKPPSSVASLNSQLASCLKAGGSAAGQAAADAQNKDTAAVQADASTLKSASVTCTSVIGQLKAKGVTLTSASGNSGSSSGSSGNS